MKDVVGKLYSVIKFDRIKNENKRRILGMENIPGKIKENRLRWVEYVKKINNDKIVKKIGEIRVGKYEEKVDQKRSEWRSLGKI